MFVMGNWARLDSRLMRRPLMALSLPIKRSSPPTVQCYGKIVNQQLMIRNLDDAKNEYSTPRRRLKTEDSGERACRGEWPD